jgi:thymidine phosphorylase
MKTLEETEALAQTMVGIGTTRAGHRVLPVASDTNQSLRRAVDNVLEIV